MKEIIKAELLEAMITTLKEYEERTHRAQLDNCKLCNLYHDGGCSSCPMSVFYDADDHIYPCMNRKCRPLTCESIYYPKVTKTDIRLRAVIKFYKSAIKHVKTLTDDDFKGPNPFKFLIDIDNKTAETIKLPEFLYAKY